MISFLEVGAMERSNDESQEGCQCKSQLWPASGWKVEETAEEVYKKIWIFLRGVEDRRRRGCNTKRAQSKF